MKGVEKLQEERAFLRKGGLSHIGGSAGPISKKDFLHWQASFYGPKYTPYEGGLFYIEMKFNENYPKEKPEVIMKTKIYHPNINESGKICLDYLNSKWTENNNVRGIVDSVCELLAEPNFDSPLNFSIDKINYEKIAKEYTQKYALEDQEINWNK
jgi:ubiquitin-conjugating enzyme E2 D/E